MDKKSLFHNIADRYKYSVIMPANTFTVDNPDVLIYNDHVLVGLYIPIVKEVNKPDLLLRRLFLSRLAMCNSLCSILLLTEKDSIGLLVNEQVLASFDYIHVFDGIQDLLSFLAEDMRPSHFIDKRLRNSVLNRFWGILDFYERTEVFKDEYSSLRGQKGLCVNSWSSPGNKRISKKTYYEDYCIVTSKGITKQSFKEGYEEIMTFATMFSFSLSEGILKRIPENNELFMYLNVESPEIIMRNEINLRSMVFSGYLPCRINEDTDLRNFSDRYYSFMKAGKYL